MLKQEMNPDEEKFLDFEQTIIVTATPQKRKTIDRVVIENSWKIKTNSDEIVDHKISNITEKEQKVVKELEDKFKSENFNSLLSNYKNKKDSK